MNVSPHACNFDKMTARVQARLGLSFLGRLDDVIVTMVGGILIIELICSPIIF